MARVLMIVGVIIAIMTTQEISCSYVAIDDDAPVIVEMGMIWIQNSEMQLTNSPIK